MLYCAINHLKARKMICVTCGKYNINCLDIEKNKTLLNMIKYGANEGLDIKNLKEPTGFSNSCKTNLYQKKTNRKVNEFKETKLILTKFIIETLPRFKGNFDNIQMFFFLCMKTSLIIDQKCEYPFNNQATLKLQISYVHLSVRMSVHLPSCLSICMFVVCNPVCSTVRLPVHPSIGPSTCVTVRQSVRHYETFCSCYNNLYNITTNIEIQI